MTACRVAVTPFTSTVYPAVLGRFVASQCTPKRQPVPLVDREALEAERVLIAAERTLRYARADLPPVSAEDVREFLAECGIETDGAS